MATVVCALILLMAMPPESFFTSLLIMLPIVASLAYWKWRRYNRSLEGAENVWLDDDGLHWLDGAGQRQTLAREGVVGFRIATEADTLRQVPSLTLLLNSEFESQPFELHAPADAESMRELLSQQWQLREETGRAGDDQLPYDRALECYSECHAENFEWHFAGSSVALAELAAIIEQCRDLPLPPVGAKPRGRIVLARRGVPSYLHLEHAQLVRIDINLLSGPADFLTELARSFRLPRTAHESKRDLHFEFRTARGETWTFHLHVEL